MRSHFAIQARLIERHGGKVIRDETRLGTATALDDAVREAGRHVADGFTAWIYRVESGAGPVQTYEAVQILRPDPGPI
nr:hypothetical protein [Deltaproteobacteria bacterium]